MRTTYLCVVLLVTASIKSEATDFWKRDYSKADSVAATVTDVAELKILSLRLTQSLPDSIDKYRAIFSWIANNIGYDCEAYHKTTGRNVTPEFVLSAKSTICSGYSNLFKALCDQAGLPCEVIVGWAKAHLSDIGSNLPKESDHAWNAIKIENQWYFCDATWGAGSASGNCKEFIKKFKDFYFCTPPALFNLKHYPEKLSWWQGQRMSKQKFASLPLFYSSALENGVRDPKPETGIINYKQGKIQKFTFTMGEEVTTVAVKSSGKNFTYPDFKQEGGIVTFEYILKGYSPTLTVYLNGGAIAYKLTK